MNSQHLDLARSQVSAHLADAEVRRAQRQARARRQARRAAVASERAARRLAAGL